jgi:uncharacterized protein
MAAWSRTLRLDPQRPIGGLAQSGSHKFPPAPSREGAMNISSVAWVAWVRRHQLIAYVVLACTISWILVAPLVAAGLGLAAPRVPDAWHALGALGPVVSAVVITALVAGRRGLRQLLTDAGRWRVGIGWWLAAGLSPFMLFAISAALLRLLGQPWPDFGLLAARFGDASWLSGALIASLVYGIGEEPGWRGFMLPRLQRRWNALAAASIVAVFWALWHAAYFTYRYHLGYLDALFFFLGVFAGSIWLTCLYNGGRGSLLPVMLWHVAWNAVNVIAAVAAPQLAPWLTVEVIIAAVIIVFVWKPDTLAPTTTRAVAAAQDTLGAAAIPTTAAVGPHSAWWARFTNPAVLWLLRSPAHGLISSSVAALTVTGRRSGARYALPVGYTVDGAGLLVVSPREHSWWRNLMDEAPVTVRVRGRDIPCVGRASADPDQVAAGLLVFLRQARRYQRAWSTPLGADGEPQDPQDLAQAARRMALLQLTPSAPAVTPDRRKEALYEQSANQPADRATPEPARR